MKPIETIEQALSIIPKHFPLVPGVDKWKEGDKKADSGLYGGVFLAENLDGIVFGEYVGERQLGFRPIPQEIRLQEARWALYDSLAKIDPNGNGLQFRVFVNSQGETCLIHVSRGTGFNGLRQFVSPYSLGRACDLLGGESAVIEMLTRGPGALWRWVMENRQLKKP